jgi:hypothetical protein
MIEPTDTCRGHIYEALVTLRPPQIILLGSQWTGYMGPNNSFAWSQIVARFENCHLGRRAGFEPPKPPRPAPGYSDHIRGETNILC